MPETWRIILTSSITIVGGITVFTLGRLLVVLFVDPIHHLRNLIGEIADSLIFYANVIANPGSPEKKMIDEASETLRRQSSQLRARAYSLPWYRLWSLLNLVRRMSDIEDAASELMGLSNSVYGSASSMTPEHNVGASNTVRQLLGVAKSGERDIKQTESGYALTKGILLFLFALILLGLQDTAPLVLFGFQILTESIWFYIYRSLGIILALTSFIFMIAVFRVRLAFKLGILLEGRPINRSQVILQFLLWGIFLFTYLSGWLKSRSGISNTIWSEPL